MKRTDEASPFALRSTRNHPRTAMHQGCPVACGRGPPGRWCRCSCYGRPRRDPCQRFARNCATRSLTSPRDLTSTAPLTSVVVAREVLRGVVNPRRIDGKDGVAGSIPAGGSTQTSSTGRAKHPACSRPGMGSRSGVPSACHSGAHAPPISRFSSRAMAVVTGEPASPSAFGDSVSTVD